MTTQLPSKSSILVSQLHQQTLVCSTHHQLQYW